MKTLTTKVTRVDVLTKDAKALYLAPIDGAEALLPGQFLTVIADISDKEVRRSYSIFTHGSEELGIGIKRVPGGVVSNHINDQARPGMTLKVLGPSGNFYYDAANNSASQLILVAGGSGITPMLAIAKSALQKVNGPKVVLLYVNRSQEDVMFAEDVNALTEQHAERFTLCHYFDAEHASTSITKRKGLRGLFGATDTVVDPGFITPQRANALLQDLNLDYAAAEAYLCGPTGLMDMMSALLGELGVSDDNMKKEQFTPSTSAPAAPDFTPPACEATITQAGKTQSFSIAPGVNVLQAAIEAKIDMPFSCREGTCTACYCRIKNGDVGMLSDEALTNDDIAEGGFLPCVAFPKSKKLDLFCD